MQKIVVCITGVVNRSIKYTWDSINDNIIDELKKEYEVDIAIFNNNVEECLVDGVKVNNNDMSIIPYDFLFEYKQTFIDFEVKKIEGEDKDFSSYNQWKNQKKNGLRLMYVESQVSKFLDENKDNYTYALITNADYFYLNKFPLECISNIRENIIGTSHHWEACDMCTDGFYIGQPNTISKIMKKIHYYYGVIQEYENPNGLNYERILNECIKFNNINRLKIDIFFLKIRANLHLKNSAPEREKYNKMFKEFLDKNKDNNTYGFLLENIIID